MEVHEAQMVAQESAELAVQAYEVEASVTSRSTACPIFLQILHCKDFHGY